MIFFSPYNRVYIQIAIEVTNPIYLQPGLQKSRMQHLDFISNPMERIYYYIYRLQSVMDHKIPKEIIS